MVEFDCLSEMKKSLDETVCLRKRKDLLLKVIGLYEAGEYSLVNSILPVQIEGVFLDLLIDLTTFSRFSDLNMYSSKVLKEKINHLIELPDGIYAEAAEYFQNYYNNMARNPAAHGQYFGNSDPAIEEITASEQILDLGFMVYMVSRISETEKMHRFIKGYIQRASIFDHSEHPCFGALFHDIIGERLHVDYDMLDTFSPLHIAFWIMNPYYEKIYKSVDDETDLLELRKEFISPEFWQFVCEKMEHIPSRTVPKEFRTMVSGLFKCEIPDATREELKKVHKKYNEIKMRR